MKVNDFIRKLTDIVVNHRTLYVNGCFGSPMTDYNKARYTNNTEYNKQPDRTELINNATSDTFGFDCVNLIKGVLWGWNGYTNHSYGGAIYASNGVPDIGELTIMNMCSEQSTDFSYVPIGSFLWLDGHCGVYVGDNMVIECTPLWRDGVQYTSLDARQWLRHGLLPWVTYIEHENITAKTALMRLAENDRIRDYDYWYNALSIVNNLEYVFIKWYEDFIKGEPPK